MELCGTLRIKKRHGNEFIYVRKSCGNPAEMMEKRGKAWK